MEKKMTAREKLLDAIEVCEQNGTLWTHVKVAELKEVLGAAVSASPQPRCPKCGNDGTGLGEALVLGIANVKCWKCATRFEIKQLSDLAPFFAPSPAQEPPKAVLHVENSSRCRHCGKKIKFVTGNWYNAELLAKAICAEDLTLALACSRDGILCPHKPEPRPCGDGCKGCEFCRSESDSKDNLTEPISSGASTGEQPPHVHTQACYECGHDDCPCHGAYFHEQPMCISEAARPSEPSAPKVEPPIQRHYAIIGDYSSIDGATRKEACGYRSCGKPYSDPIHIQPEEMAHEAGSQTRKPLSYEEAKKVATQATETASAPQEFLRKEQLVSGLEESTWGKYTRNGESEMVGNALAWYESAVYWRNQAELGYQPKFDSPAAAAPSVAGTQPTPCDFCENKRCSHPLMWHKGRLVHHATGKSGYYPCTRFPGAAQGTPQVEEIARECVKLANKTFNEAMEEDGPSPPVFDIRASDFAAILRKHLLGAPDQPGPDISKLRSIWPIINRYRGLLIDRKLAGSISQDELVFLESLQIFADWYLGAVVPRDASELERLEAIVASPAQGTPEPPKWLDEPFSTGESWRDTIKRALKSAEGSYVRRRLLECMTVEKIAELAALAGPQNGQGWERVEDRLPKYGQKVEILISDESVAIEHWPTTGYVLYGGEWWCGVPGHYVLCSRENWTVTHWKDLPDLPLPATPTGDAPTEKKL